MERTLLNELFNVTLLKEVFLNLNDERNSECFSTAAKEYTAIVFSKAFLKVYSIWTLEYACKGNKLRTMKTY